MVFLGWLLGIVVAIVVIAIVVVFLNRFYRKSTRDIALVRTGFGGQRIVISGGCLALPFLHKVDEINMRTIRVEVRRAGDKSLITVDRIRVDVELEFYVRVQPTVEGIATAAQAIGSRSFNPEGIRNLLEGRFVDALQSVAAAETMDSLHERRGEFVRHVAEQLRENLSVNGILLDSVSLTRLAWDEEYLDLVLAVRVVDGIDAAIDHIRRHGTGLAEAIVTNDLARSRRFTSEVDAAAVLVNASPRLVDGQQFGMGAEMGISTSRVHARGPVGVRELTTTKFVVRGDGQVRE